MMPGHIHLRMNGSLDFSFFILVEVPSMVSTGDCIGGPTGGQSRDLVRPGHAEAARLLHLLWWMTQPECNGDRMRILVLNPNTTESVTQLMMAAGKPAAAAGTELVALTATRGVPYIATRAEAQIGGAIALEMIAESHREVDAVIIAAFGDPGLLGARELFDMPVIGISEAAMLTACMLGQRFALVALSTVFRGWYRDCVDMHGLTGRCAGVYGLDKSFASIADVQDENLEALVALAEHAIEDGGADSLIFAGAPLAGLAAKVRDRIPLPIVDPIAAAVKQAETVVALAPRKATIGSFKRPSAKTSIGLAAPLAGHLGHQDG
jgi:Asp/Glu/hydantoin racemase